MKRLYATGVILTAGMALGACERGANGVGPTAPVSIESLAEGQREREGYVAPGIGRVVLEPGALGNTCSWSPKNPQSRPEAGKFQIDGRCVADIPPNGSPDNNWVNVYSMPRQESGLRRTSVRSTTIVDGLCFTEGQTIQDAAGDKGKGTKSDMWVAIRVPRDETGAKGVRGFVPAFATGYGLPENPCGRAMLDQIKNQ